MSGTLYVVGCDLFDEFGDVDAGGATFYAGRIIAKQATVGLDQRGFFILERGVDVGEVGGVL